MTANLIKGKGFRGALRYNLGKVAKNAAEVLDSTFARSTEQGIMKEVQMIRSMRPRLEKYFYHTSINFPPEENISSDLMKRLGREYLEASGFTQHQFIMFRHFDAAHPHLHILVNRIGYDGQVISDSKDYQRTEDVLRKLEIKYDLRQVAPSRQAKQRAVTKNEIEMMKRTGEPSQKVKLQYFVNKALNGRPTLEGFVTLLKKNGVTVLLNQASTGYVSGISYEFGGFRTTGAKLGAAYKWSAVKMRIDYPQPVPFSHNKYASEPDALSIGMDKIAPQEMLDPRFSEILSELIRPEHQPDMPQGTRAFSKKRKRKSRRR